MVSAVQWCRWNSKPAVNPRRVCRESGRIKYERHKVICEIPLLKIFVVQTKQKQCKFVKFLKYARIFREVMHNTSSSSIFAPVKRTEARRRHAFKFVSVVQYNDNCKTSLV